MKERINVKRLMSDAKKSCCRESFIVLGRNPILRIGAGARVGDDGVCLLFIEITLKLCPGKSITSTVSLEKGVQLAKALRGIGYELTCEEGQVSFEKVVAASEMNREYEKALGIINENGLADLTDMQIGQAVPA